MKRAFRSKPRLRVMMHLNLSEVLDFYDRGGEANPWLDARMEPLGLTDQEKEDLLAFLESLTGEVPEWAGRAPRLPPAEIGG